ncbi:hypothetical protein HPB51_016999 [Rhipicephalus microplus]|uniref:glutamine synthetase n=1 Tax=Rhipicephalus microplus TaxID=6941 RepID=A0A9J6F436_RHIMP|nr:hypothetical protein HPB51_016999 [Rhipicephalus microplus]
MATYRPDIMERYLELEQPDDVVFCTYVFVDGTLENVRAKTRTLDFEPKAPEDCPRWTFCALGTYQWGDAGAKSEMYMEPVALFRDPFLKGRNKLVLCQVLKYDGTPHGPFFFGVGAENTIGRQISDAHLKACAYAGVKISGTNSEVVLSQWEYQVGPLEGTAAGDHLWISRYILKRVAEEFDVVISFDPKPFENDALCGSGGHINFSTKDMRKPGGLEHIKVALQKLEANAAEHLRVYDPRKGGGANRRRLGAGMLATPNENFVVDSCSREASVRVPRLVYDAGQGYLEDRRPGANVEPYSATAAIVKTVCL